MAPFMHAMQPIIYNDHLHGMSVAGQAQVDAHSILLTFCAFIYVSFPFGVSTAATIRVGNLVGANQPAEARLAGMQLLQVYVLFTLSVIYAFRALTCCCLANAGLSA